MPLDLPVVVWCLAIPSLLAAVGVIINWRLDARRRSRPASLTDPQLSFEQSSPNEKSTQRFVFGAAQVVLGLCVALAAMSSLQGNVGLTALFDFNDQAWCQLVWGMLLATMLAFTTKSDLARHSSFWVASSMLAIATSFAVMPSGESWSDTIPLHRYWLPLIAMAAIASHWALRQLVIRDAGRWVAWVALASLADRCCCVRPSYSALLNVCLAVSTSVAGIAIAASLGYIKNVQGIFLPTALCASAMSGSARFYSYDEPSAINYGLAMFLPVVVDAIDRPLRQKPTWQRVLAAAIVCTLVVLFLGYRIMGPTNEEW